MNFLFYPPDLVVLNKDVKKYKNYKIKKYLSCFNVKCKIISGTHRNFVEESPFNCSRPCTKVSYSVEKLEFPSFNYSLISKEASTFYIGIETTDIEIHEEYVLVRFFQSDEFSSHYCLEMIQQ